VGTSLSDDGAVYRVSDQLALVLTTDFFTPIVDDPYDFGRIAAANALSDVYAMGGDPFAALNLVGFPRDNLPISVLQQILAGGATVCDDAGVTIVGGHTVDDQEPKYGLAVTGRVDPDRIFSNDGAKPGDVIVLTKPIGTGILSTAIKAGIAEKDHVDVAVGWMTQLNSGAALAMHKCDIDCCTDVTGFGLIGHALNIARASEVTIRFNLSSIPILPGVTRYIDSGHIPSGSERNLESVSRFVHWDEHCNAASRLLLTDAQTSGGLLIAANEGLQSKLLEFLETEGITGAQIIGRVCERGPYPVIVCDD
tara:strand:- start:1866 stop:2792 length:927 start_codon:yes stop_codon:yes gene_type:complete